MRAPFPRETFKTEQNGWKTVGERGGNWAETRIERRSRVYKGDTNDTS